MIASAAMSKVDGYVNDVLSGDIVVCDLVRKAVQRYVDDLARQNTDEFPYYFDPTHASIAIDFFAALKHSIGEFVGLPFVLEPWQAFGVANIHGWKRLDGARRFRHVYWSTARKNGKSTWAAGEAIQLAAMDRNPITQAPESVAEIILCATKVDQANIIYKEACRMRAASEPITAMSEDINRQIRFSHNDGYVRTVSSDKSYDGLNSHGTIKDELHAWKETHRDCYNTITTGGATRTQPLDITVTTAGDTESLIWIEEYNHARGVLNGIYKDETTFVWCFEIDKDDDPADESTWIKANPNLHTAVKLEYLQEQIARYHGRLGRNVFTRYHCNRSVSSHEQAFDLDLWDACEGELSDWSEADAIGGGVDLGGLDDLASWGLVARFATGEVQKGKSESDDPIPIWRYEIRGRSYLADNAERDIAKPPMAEFIHEDKVHQCEYPVSELRNDLVWMCREYHVSDVAYDPAQAQLFAENMAQQGVLAAAMPQSTKYFTAPIRELLQAIKDGRVTHNGDPVLRWCVCNAIAKQNANMDVMYDKSKSTEKIDAIVSVTMGFWRAMVASQRARGELFVC